MVSFFNFFLFFCKTNKNFPRLSFLFCRANLTWPIVLYGFSLLLGLYLIFNCVTMDSLQLIVIPFVVLFTLNLLIRVVVFTYSALTVFFGSSWHIMPALVNGFFLSSLLFQPKSLSLVGWFWFSTALFLFHVVYFYGIKFFPSRFFTSHWFAGSFTDYLLFSFSSFDNFRLFLQFNAVVGLGFDLAWIHLAPELRAESGDQPSGMDEGNGVEPTIPDLGQNPDHRLIIDLVVKRQQMDLEISAVKKLQVDETISSLYKQRMINHHLSILAKQMKEFDALVKRVDSLPSGRREFVNSRFSAFFDDEKNKINLVYKNYKIFSTL